MSRNEIIGLSEFDLIKLAKNAKDTKLLDFLSDSIFSTVRRCVAKNTNSSIPTIDKLAKDSSSNVSYWANKNNSCTSKRIIFSTHPCVTCLIDETEYKSSCISCTKPEEYNHHL